MFFQKDKSMNSSASTLNGSSSDFSSAELDMTNMRASFIAEQEKILQQINFEECDLDISNVRDSFLAEQVQILEEIPKGKLMKKLKKMSTTNQYECPILAAMYEIQSENNNVGTPEAKKKEIKKKESPREKILKRLRKMNRQYECDVLTAVDEIQSEKIKA